MSIFVDEQSIGVVEFKDEKSKNPVFLDEQSRVSIEEAKIKEIISNKLTEFEDKIPKVKHETKIVKEELSQEKFGELFKNLPEDIVVKFKGERGLDGKDGSDGLDAKDPMIYLESEIARIEKSVDNGWIKKEITKLFNKAQSKQLQEPLTFDQFLAFFKSLPPEELRKIRGRKGGDGAAGGSGPQGPQGEQGEPGSSVAANPALLEFQELAGVVGLSETQVLTFTNSTGSSIFLDEVFGESNARSEWIIYIDDVEKTRARSSVSDLNVQVPLFNSELTNTQNIKVKVIHYESSTIDYSVTLKYHA